MLTMLAALLDGAFLLLAHVSSRSSFPRPLSAEEEKKTIFRLAAGDSEAGRILIEHNLRLVAHIAKKYARSGIDADDLVSIGSLGLIKAVATFRPEAGRLTAYASRCIENEILMALRANRKNRQNLSLNEPIGADHEGNEIMISDILGTEEDLVPHAAETHIEAAKALKILNGRLDRREKTVLLLRYGLLDGVMHPQHQVARALGISRSYVSRIEKRALGKLRAELEKQP